MNYVKLAEEIATQAHAGQFRRDGVTPYIVHPEAVASRVDSPDLKVVAWLHDVIEDTPLTAKDLLDKGIKDDHIQAVILLTKKKGQSNKEYWDAIKPNSLARKVKIADMLTNLNDDPTDYQRTKYALGLKYLSELTEI